jgi:hypothetical protein
MRGIILATTILILTGCSNDDLTWISIMNGTGTPIYALPYSSDFTNGDWIQPGVSDEFYSINCELDGFEYFSFYYDSLIVYLKDQGEDPIKFFKDGTTINYDPKLNPFINKDVWLTHNFDRHLSGSVFKTLEEKHIFEYYFTVDAASVKSITISHE